MRPAPLLVRDFQVATPLSAPPPTAAALLRASPPGAAYTALRMPAPPPDAGGGAIALGNVPLFAEHLDRLVESAQALCLGGETVNREAVLDTVSGSVTFALESLQRQREQGSLSIIEEDIMMVMTLSLDGTKSAMAANGARPTVDVFVNGIDRETFNSTVPRRAVLATYQRAVPLAKSCQWASERLPLEALKDGLGCHEVIMMTPDSSLLEGLVTNIFVIVETGPSIGGGRALALVTPALDQGILPGIFRRAVMTLAHQSGLPVEERQVKLSEKHCWKALLLTNAVKGIVAVEAMVDSNGNSVWRQQKSQSVERVLHSLQAGLLLLLQKAHLPDACDDGFWQ